MKRIISLILVITIAIFACATLSSCGIINGITGEIAKQEIKKAKAALLYDAYNGGNSVEFTQLTAEELAKFTIPAEIKEVYSASAGGYVFIGVTGSYFGDITVAVGVNADGALTGVKVVSHADTENKIQGVINAIEGNNGKYNGQSIYTFSPVIVAGSTVSSDACALIVDAALHAFASLTGKDIRTNEEIFQDNCNILLRTEGKTFTRWFATIVIPNVDDIYVTDNPNDGLIMVIGDKLIGVKVDGTVTDTVGKLDKKAKKVATSAEDIAVVEAAYAIFETAGTTEIALPNGAKATVKKAYVTAGGTYVFEMEADDCYSMLFGHGAHKPINFTVSIGADGKIIDIITTSHAESNGFGKKCATEEFYASFRGATREDVLDSVPDFDVNEFDPEGDEDAIPNGTTGPGIIANATVTTYYYQTAVLDAFDAFLKLTNS